MLLGLLLPCRFSWHPSPDGIPLALPMHADWMIHSEFSAAAATGVPASTPSAEAVCAAVGLENVTEAELKGEIHRPEGDSDVPLRRVHPQVLPHPRVMA